MQSKWFVLLFATACGPSLSYSTAFLATPSGMSSALTIGGAAASFSTLNGTYGAGCTGRTGAFSVAFPGYSGAMPNPGLSVVRNNAACVLTLTSVLANSATYSAVQAIALGTNYQGSAATAFSNGTPAFYANAKISATSFAANFTITLYASDDPNDLVPPSTTATYATVNGSASATLNPPPDYTADLSTFAVQVDAANLVVAATGDVMLTVQAQSGEGYAISSDASLDTTDANAVASAYTSPTAITDSPIDITATSLDLVGVDLSADNVVRRIIIAHTQNGVTSYQVITLGLHPATP